jgi:GT2 family glycosyltransferase
MNDTKHVLSVGVLVLNYNTWDLALRALDEAIRLEWGSIEECVLFDDGSQVPPPPEIDRRIRVIRGEVNRGYTGALKIAFAEMKSDLVVLFDADAYPLEQFTTCVRERFESDKKLGQLAFFSVDDNGSPTESFLRGEPTKWSLLLGQRLYALIARDKLRSSELCVFSCCMATRLEAYIQVGGIDENFDFLDADLDYSMRLRKAGWKIEADRSLKAFHKGGGWSQLQRHRVLRFYKSRWYLLRKHKLITNVRLARAFILTRLRLERALLKLFGTLMFRDPNVLSEKISGRRELIYYCRENYR